MIKGLTGGQAAAEALRQINPAVMAAYPITPQTPIIESYAQMVADHKVDTEYLAVESEHSALSAALAAQVTGVRATTATASQGLAYMYEMLPVVSGLRMPVLMNVAARALSAPINIHCDHSDVMAARDCGWLQIFAENPQEVYDLNLIGLTLAEEVSLPVMVIQDGFITSHCLEKVDLLEDEVALSFVGTRQPPYSLLEHAPTVGPVALPDSQMEAKENQSQAFSQALETYPRLCQKYHQISGRNYDWTQNAFLNEAQAVLVALGSSAGTLRYVAGKMRQENFPVGVVKATLYRPFPYEVYNHLLSPIPAVGVLDRSLAYGAEAPLYTDVKASLYEETWRPYLESFIYGLGGRDFQAKDAREIFLSLLGEVE